MKNVLLFILVSFPSLTSCKKNMDHGLRDKWSPDFVDVSSSGDLGYTYGQYNVSVFKCESRQIRRNINIEENAL